jgi:hypothetical protein
VPFEKRARSFVKKKGHTVTSKQLCRKCSFSAVKARGDDHATKHCTVWRWQRVAFIAVVAFGHNQKFCTGFLTGGVAHSCTLACSRKSISTLRFAGPAKNGRFGRCCAVMKSFFLLLGRRRL